MLVEDDLHVELILQNDHALPIEQQHMCGAACVQMVLQKIGANFAQLRDESGAIVRLVDYAPTIIQGAIFRMTNPHEGEPYEGLDNSPIKMTGTLERNRPALASRLPWYLRWRLPREAFTLFTLEKPADESEYLVKLEDFTKLIIKIIYQTRVPVITLIKGLSHYVVVSGYSVETDRLNVSNYSSFNVSAIHICNPLINTLGIVGYDEWASTYFSYQDYDMQIIGKPDNVNRQIQEAAKFFYAIFLTVIYPIWQPIALRNLVLAVNKIHLNLAKDLNSSEIGNAAVKAVEQYKIFSGAQWVQEYKTAEIKQVFFVKSLESNQDNYYLTPITNEKNRAPVLLRLSAKSLKFQEAALRPAGDFSSEIEKANIVLEFLRKELIGKLHKYEADQKEYQIKSIEIHPESHLCWKFCAESYSPLQPFYYFLAQMSDAVVNVPIYVPINKHNLFYFALTKPKSIGT